MIITVASLTMPVAGATGPSSPLLIALPILCDAKSCGRTPAPTGSAPGSRLEEIAGDFVQPKGDDLFRHWFGAGAVRGCDKLERKAYLLSVLAPLIGARVSSRSGRHRQQHTLFAYPRGPSMDERRA